MRNSTDEDAIRCKPATEQAERTISSRPGHGISTITFRLTTIDTVVDSCATRAD